MIYPERLIDLVRRDAKIKELRAQGEDTAAQENVRKELLFEAYQTVAEPVDKRDTAVQVGGRISPYLLIGYTRQFDD